MDHARGRWGITRQQRAAALYTYDRSGKAQWLQAARKTYVNRALAKKIGFVPGADLAGAKTIE